MLRIRSCAKPDTVWADFIIGEIGRAGRVAALPAASATGSIPPQRLPHPSRYALHFTDISLP